LKTDIGISREQISLGKRFILSWKVGENEFSRVVGTMYNQPRLAQMTYAMFYTYPSVTKHYA